MTGNKSVVTPERFASGFTYRDYVAQVNVNRDRFDEFYKMCQISSDDASFFRRVAGMPNSVARMLVLGEDWCPDVFRGLPVMARIAEASGMEMRVFPRDQHLDIMNEFLNRGQFMSIPTVAFFTRDLHYLCRWAERPELANQERARIQAEVEKEKPGASEQEVRKLVGERTRERYPAWQQETVREIRHMLAERLGV